MATKAVDTATKAQKPEFSWEDPLLLEDQLSEEERMVRDAARDYCQDKLMPRVLEATATRRFDRAIMTEMGALGLLGSTIPRLRLRRRELRLLRPDRARGRARRLRLSLGDERAVDRWSCIRSTPTAPRSSGRSTCRKLATGEMGRLLRPDRARPRLRPGRHDDARAARSTAAICSTAARCGSPTRRSPTCSSCGRRTTHRRRDPRLHPREGHEGPVGAEDRRQVQPARLGHRRDRDGRRVRARGEPAAQRRAA